MSGMYKPGYYMVPARPSSMPRGMSHGLPGIRENEDMYKHIANYLPEESRVLMQQVDRENRHEDANKLKLTSHRIDRFLESVHAIVVEIKRVVRRVLPSLGDVDREIINIASENPRSYEYMLDRGMITAGPSTRLVAISHLLTHSSESIAAGHIGRNVSTISRILRDFRVVEEMLDERERQKLKWLKNSFSELAEIFLMVLT